MPIRKRTGSPYWQIHIGRETRFSSGTTDYERAKELEQTERERLWKLEKLGDRGAVPWFEAAERWLNSTAKAKRRDREILDWLAKRMTRTDTVTDVADPDALEELRRDGLEDGWSHSTIDRMMGTVSAVLHACVGWQMIDRPPAFPMYRPAPGEPRFLTPDELDRLCWYSEMHQALAARVAVHTLLRMRAMLKLTKDRVRFDPDFTGGRAWIPAAHQKANRTFGLPLNIEAVRALRALITMAPPASPWIFTYGGEALDDCNTASFKAAVKRAKLEPLRWHDLRHTGASWAVQSGVTLPELMVLGDWRDYRSVLRYAHLAPSSGAAAADKVAQWAHTASERKAEARARRHK
jgi:integrase